MRFEKSSKLNRFARWKSIVDTQPQFQLAGVRCGDFAFAFFVRRQDPGFPGAISRALLDRPCLVKVHRIRDSFGVSNALLLGQ
jgi:hypothetical protein